MDSNETMEQKRVRHEALAKERGATKFQFVVMQDGVDFGCHADFGNGMEPFYPDMSTNSQPKDESRELLENFYSDVEQAAQKGIPDATRFLKNHTYLKRN